MTVFGKKIVSVLLFFPLLLSMLYGCGSKPVEETTPKEEHELVYEAYANMCMKDPKEAACQYIYFKDNELESLHMSSKSYPWTSYAITRWAQLSDDLWVVHLVVTSEDVNRDSTEFPNFVGRINGKWWVLPSILFLTEDLTDEVDLSEYERYYDNLL